MLRAISLAALAIAALTLSAGAMLSAVIFYLASGR
jgi:hypothetical protein